MLDHFDLDLPNGKEPTDDDRQGLVDELIGEEETLEFGEEPVLPARDIFARYEAVREWPGGDFPFNPTPKTSAGERRWKRKKTGCDAKRNSRSRRKKTGWPRNMPPNRLPRRP